MIEVLGLMARFSILLHDCRTYDVLLSWILNTYLPVKNVRHGRRVLHKIRN